MRNAFFAGLARRKGKIRRQAAPRSSRGLAGGGRAPLAWSPSRSHPPVDDGMCGSSSRAKHRHAGGARRALRASTSAFRPELFRSKSAKRHGEGGGSCLGGSGVSVCVRGEAARTDVATLRRQPQRTQSKFVCLPRMGHRLALRPPPPAASPPSATASSPLRSWPRRWTAQAGEAEGRRRKGRPRPPSPPAPSRPWACTACACWRSRGSGRGGARRPGRRRGRRWGASRS
jgi:hypothetical protein